MAVVLLFAGAARAGEDLSADLNAERDRLIDKIVRGVDRPAQSRRFGELWRERQQRLAAALRFVVDAKAYRAAFDASADGVAHDRCALAVDPAHPPATQEDLMAADWGRVVVVRTVKNKTDNPLAPSEIKVYDVAGQVATYVVPSHPPTSYWPELTAEQGDWLLVCTVKSDVYAGLRIGGQPLISRKAKWNPVHMPPKSFDWVIYKQNWYYPPGVYVLTHVIVDKDLGGGRLSIGTPAHSSWILEAAPSLRNRALLKPGRGAWVIAGKARLDAALGKLVLTAEDVEERYLP
jgi:hypothetical protein